MARLFRYYREDFTLPVVQVLHMDLGFDIYDDYTAVKSVITMKTRSTGLARLDLNAHDLEIISVSSDSGMVRYHYEKENNKLVISFSSPVPPDTAFAITTHSICRPTDNILEGLYYDVSPPGAPPQQITQCQQWGFQRIVPCIDDMTAKCTYTTTITADERYTSLISNGDIVEAWHKTGGGRAMIRYINTKTPMAPYLFFLGAGTYQTFSRKFEYPGGGSFMLELLLPPGSDEGRAAESLAILANAVLWVYLFTGPGQYEETGVRYQLYDLARQFEREKNAGAGPSLLEPISTRMNELIRNIRTGYRYTGTVYREIAMQNSDFGGMENVGNTTITTNRIMPFPRMTDPAYEYMIGVKVHEYYHNLNGSEVTGMTPFELWLNEAVTVFVETQHMAFLAGDEYTRLKNILSLLSPAGGTFALDSGSASMPIEPEGFDDPNDLITSITYVKGPEFVRMVETMIGKEQFVRGLDLYHTRYRHGNATWQQWVLAMEEVSGTALMDMAEVWLHQKRFPDVSVTSSYEPVSRTFTLFIKQEGFGQGKPWTFPLRMALVRDDGTEIAERLVIVRTSAEETSFHDVENPAFLSLNRGYSFYGRVFYNATDDMLIMQARKDPDIIGRFLAFYQLADRQKMRLLSGEDRQPREQFIALFIELLQDEALMDIAGGQFLTIFEGVDDERFAHRYQALFRVRQELFRTLAGKYRERLLTLYRHYNSLQFPEFPVTEHFAGIKSRQVKNTALVALSSLDTPEIHEILRAQIRNSQWAGDRLFAFGRILESSAPDRIAIFQDFMDEAKQHPVSWEAFLSTVGSTAAPDGISLLHRSETSGAFRIEQTNDQRGLFGSFAMNRKVSLETPRGRACLEDILHRLTFVNEFTTVGLLRTFGAIDLMEQEHHIPLISLLVSLWEITGPEKSPSVHNTTRRLILGSPVALAAYENQNGRIPGLHE